MIKYLLILLLVTGSAQAQQLPGSFLSPNPGARGVTYNGLKALREFYLPIYDTSYTPSWEGAMVYQISDSAVYVYRHARWTVIGSGGNTNPQAYTVAALRAATTSTGSTYITNDYGGGTWVDRGVNDGSHTDNTGTILVTANNHWLERLFSGVGIDIRWFGGVGDSTDATAALNACFNYFRQNSRKIVITDPDFGTTNCYQGGRIIFPYGKYLINPGIQITDIINLQFVGETSRGASNFQNGNSNIIFNGAGSTYGIRFKGNGARNGFFENISILYNSSSFTGDLIDVWNSPGLKFNRVYWGCTGIRSVDRIQTAHSDLRMSGDEFVDIQNSFFDYADYHIFLDPLRTTTFGGSNTTIKNTCFYNAGKSYIYLGTGGQSRIGLNIEGCAFDPIDVKPDTSIVLNNVKGFNMSGCSFAGGDGAVHPNKWFSYNAVEGQMVTCNFGAFAKTGDIFGDMTINNNYVASGNGFELKGGIINANGNRFLGGCDTGFIIYPVGSTFSLVLNLGINEFDNSVDYSYAVKQTTANVAGNIKYSKLFDGSKYKFIIPDERVKLEIATGEYLSGADSINVSNTDVGKIIYTSGIGDTQYVSLPIPFDGFVCSLVKLTANKVYITLPAGVHIGQGSKLSSANNEIWADTSNVSGFLKIRAINPDFYIIESYTGDWNIPSTNYRLKSDTATNSASTATRGRLQNGLDSLSSKLIKTGIAFFSGDGSTTTFDIILPTTPSWANAETSSAAGANITYRAPITNGIRIFYAVAPPVGTNNISISYQYK